MADNQRHPFLGNMRLASDHRCESVSNAAETLGASGSLVKSSVIESMVAANELVLFNTEGVSSLLCKPVMRNVTSSGSGTTQPTIHFYGFVASGRNNSTDNLDNPWWACRTELYKNTIASGNVTGVSTNEVVRSTTGHEFFSHDDWDDGAVENGRIIIFNTRANAVSPNQSAALGVLSDVGSSADDGYFAFVNSCAPFDLFGFTFNKGDLATAICNLYYAPFYG